MTTKLRQKTQAAFIAITLLIAALHPVFSVSHLVHLSNVTTNQNKPHLHTDGIETHFHNHVQMNHLDLTLTLTEHELTFSKVAVANAITGYRVAAFGENSPPDIPPPITL